MLGLDVRQSGLTAETVDNFFIVEIWATRFSVSYWKLSDWLVSVSPRYLRSPMASKV